MYLSGEDINRFLGTGACNADGDNLSAFLEKYDPNRYQNPSNTVDTLVFTYSCEEGRYVIRRLLMIKRGNHPSIGWWALPGGFVEYRENLDDAALRELKEETGVDDIEVCQLKTYGDYRRDPRARVITTAYVALVPEGSVRAQAGDDACDSAWFEIEDTIVKEEQRDGMSKKMHRLRLVSDDGKVVLNTDVLAVSRRNALLPEVRYEVVDSCGIAADHGAIVLEGLEYVKRCLS